MPMGIVSDEVFDLEINNKTNNIKPAVIDNVVRRPFHGRKPNDNNVPSVVREIVADDDSSTQKSLANTFGISTSSVAAYQHGSTSTSSYDQPDDKLKEVVTRRRERISRKSNKALLRVLGKLDSDEFEQKLDACKATELSVVAANISRVVEKVSARPESQNVQNNIVFYTPTPLKSDTFEIIDLGRKVIDNSPG